MKFKVGDIGRLREQSRYFYNFIRIREINEYNGRCMYHFDVISDDGDFILESGSGVEEIDKRYGLDTNYDRYKKAIENREDKQITSSGEQNKPKQTNMQELTPKVIQSFTPEERQLYRAGLLTEEKNWTELARGFAIDMFLNSQRKEVVKLAQELIAEERENMLGGLLTKNISKTASNSSPTS